ncbi:hypothetical protein CPC08DRAFT_731654 [Agrocybe pediades]|nr:hypothetical protein CPC08DRAFT_731654 [Agrocybe pediades]
MLRIKLISHNRGRTLENTRANVSTFDPQEIISRTYSNRDTLSLNSLHTSLKISHFVIPSWHSAPLQHKIAVLTVICVDAYYKPFELYRMVKLAGLHPELQLAASSVALGSRIPSDLFFAVDQSSLIISWTEEPEEVKAKYSELAKRLGSIVRERTRTKSSGMAIDYADVITFLKRIEEEERLKKKEKQGREDGSDDKASGATSSPDMLQQELDALLGETRR